MIVISSESTSKHEYPVLLYNDECAVCRHIAHWVQRSAKTKTGELTLIVQPIGEDPETLKKMSASLSIWDAYATIHFVMPNGSMKLGGEAVAEVLRNLPNTKWFAWSFSLKLFGFKPFQIALNLAYVALADIRPIFGCESCGEPVFWMKPFRLLFKWINGHFGESHKSTIHSSPHLI